MTRSHTIKTTPKGWTRTAIAQIALVTQGQSPPSSSYNREKRGLPFFQGKANFGLRHPVPEVWCDKPHKIAKKGDILISVRAPVGPVNICREDCGIGRGLASIRPSPKINSIYVYYHLLFLENDIAARGTGTTFKAITGDQLRSVVLNIAPPNEQAYITSRIESLFSKIDAAKQSLEAAMSLLEQNRLSILNHAFTGRLVQHKPNNQLNLLKGWTSTEIGKICKLVGGGTPPRENPQFFGGNIPWLTPTEISKNTLEKVSKSKEMITALGLQQSSAKLVPKDAVLLTTRASIGHIAIANAQVTTNQGFTSFICSKSVDNYFLAYWLWKNRRLLVTNANGTTFKEISKSTIKKLQINVPPVITQKSIVSRIESLFSKIDAAKQSLEAAMSLLEQNRLSILNHAFTGRLVRHKSNS